MLTDAEKIEIVKNMTYRCSAELFTHVFGYHVKIFGVHKSYLYNVPYNVLGDFWSLPIMRDASWFPDP